LFVVETVAINVLGKITATLFLPVVAKGKSHSLISLRIVQLISLPV